MILSNEPGYYKAGEYGIRIENLVLVVEGPKVAGAEKPLNAFETLTLAPIDRRLIEPRLLDAGEAAWLDAYHARVAQTLSPLVDDDAALAHAATRPLGSLNLQTSPLSFRTPRSGVPESITPVPTTKCCGLWISGSRLRRAPE